MDYFEKECDFNLNVEKNVVNHPFENIVLNMNELLDEHAPFKR